MIYQIGNQTLNIPETGEERKIRTPRQVAPYRDMAETCRNLDAICQTIKTKPKTIIDGIARSGFWSAVFRNHWPDCKLIINGENEECVGILKKNFSNFPTVTIVNEDIQKWNPPKSDLCFLDFDKFTLRIINKRKKELIKYSKSCQYFVFADGACFGFKFGTLKHYGIKEPQEYYHLLNKTLKKIIGRTITAISMFNNAAVILAEKKRTNKFIMIPPTNLLITRGGKIYKPGDKSKSRTKLFQL